MLSYLSIFFVILLYYLIISIISYIINSNFIQKIMNNINKDFQRNKVDFFWNIIIIAYGGILLISYLIIIILSLYENKIGCLFRERNVNQNILNNDNNLNIIINNQIHNNLSNVNINLANNIPQNNAQNINAPNLDINDIHINIPNEGIDNSNNPRNYIFKKDNKENVNKNNNKHNNTFDNRIRDSLMKEFDINNSEEKLKEDKKEGKCIICYLNPPTVILAPCHHRCLCNECYKKNKNIIKKCLICRQNIIDFVDKIYDP